MRRVLVLVGIALVGWLVLGQPAAQAQETKWVRGTVKSLSGDTLVVAVGGQDMTFTVDKTTQVVARGAGTAAREAQAKGAEGAKLGEVIKVGEGVEVHYTTSGTTNKATVIRGGITNLAMQEGGTEGKSVTGKVTAVSNDKLTVSAEGKEYQFTVDPKVRVVGTGAGTLTRKMKEEGKTPTLTDYVANDDEVMVSYTEKGGAMQTSDIRVIRKAPKK